MIHILLQLKKKAKNSIFKISQNQKIAILKQKLRNWGLQINLLEKRPLRIEQEGN